MATPTAQANMLAITNIWVPVLIALVGWFATFAFDKMLERRRARLQRINDQLRLLYGPLYSILSANQAAWEAFCKTCWPAHGGSSYFGPDLHVSEEEKERWRHWMQEVFHPSNKRIEEIITNNMDMMEGTGIPEAFKDMMAHIAVYHAVVRDWEKGNFSRHTSTINFPGAAMMQAVEPIFFALREKQAKLTK